jgi:hypothetical protein
MTEAPAAIANLCREGPTAELTGRVVCTPRRRAILATPLSICDDDERELESRKLETRNDAAPACVT